MPKTEEKVKELNPSKRVQDKEKDEDKEEIRRLYNTIALLRTKKNSWKRRARTMEKKRNEWKVICSFMLLILVILAFFNMLGLM